MKFFLKNPAETVLNYFGGLSRKSDAFRCVTLSGKACAQGFASRKNAEKMLDKIKLMEEENEKKWTKWYPGDPYPKSEIVWEVKEESEI